MLDEMKIKDPYEDQLSSARYRAERDVALQEIDRMRPAFEWVEEHGGLEKIKRQRRESFPRDAYERKRGKLLKHIAECEKALGKRKRRVEELEAEVKGLRERIEAMIPRLMPKGYMWPKYENGDPVCIGDEFADGGGNTRRCVSIEILHVEVDVFDALIHWDDDDPYAYLLVNMWQGDRVKRPKVLDADEVEIRVGDTVWATNGHGPFEVTRIVNADRLRVVCDDEKNGHLNVYPENITHRAPVLAADGRPLQEGEKPYRVDNGKQVEIRRIDPSYDESCVFVGVDGMAYGYWLRPDQLTHERPDSWERLEEDAKLDACDYFSGKLRHECSECPASCLDSCESQKSLDIVRRAKKLTGAE